MSFISNVFHNFLYRPLFNLLIFLYNFIPGRDFGITIIVLTVLIRILLYPLAKKAIESQRAFSRIQPKIKEIQERYKEDKNKQMKEIMAFYQKEKINPFFSFLPLLIQMPVLIALYWVFWQGFQQPQADILYNFVSNPGKINPFFLGIVNLSQPSLVLAFLAGILQFWQAKTTIAKKSVANKKTKKEKNSSEKPDIGKIVEKQMLYFMPFLTFFILLRIPSVIGLYWSISNLFTIFQRYAIKN